MADNSMTIELMRIRSINDRNVYRWKQGWHSLFNRFIVSTVSHSFFPPKYTNEINFLVDDIGGIKPNYLRFNYLDRYYYYFIDSINYINESVIMFNIRLDTVTTYLDMMHIEGILERCHINRWTNTSTREINRNYIRENLSDGLFLEQSKYYVVQQPSLKWLVVKTTAELRTGVNNRRQTFIKPSGYNGYIPCAYGLYIGPLDDMDITVSYSDDNPQVLTYPYINLLAAVTDNRITEINVLPFCPVTELHYNYGSLVCDWTRAQTEDSCAPFMSNIKYTYTVIGYDGRWGVFTTKTYEGLVSLNNTITFAANVTLSRPFDKTYIPCLFDENYMRLSYGSETANMGYPIHTIKGFNENLKYTYKANIDEGTLTYELYNDTQGDNSSRYGTIVIDSNVLSLSLANDPWQNYLANIKGRIFSVGMDVLNTGAACFVDVAATKTTEKLKLGRIYGNSRNFDRRYKTNKLRRKPADKVQEITDRAAGEISDSIAGFGARAAMRLGDEAAAMFNAKWSAPTPKSLGTCLDGFNAKQLSIWYQWSIVEDIDFVAQFYHRYGNLVNKQVNYQPLFAANFTKSRRYFNYVKFAEVQVTINAIEEDVVLEDIESRLKAGITFWDLDDLILDGYQYDNVEVDYL